MSPAVRDDDAPIGADPHRCGAYLPHLCHLLFPLDHTSVFRGGRPTESGHQSNLASRACRACGNHARARINSVNQITARRRASNVLSAAIRVPFGVAIRLPQPLRPVFATERGLPWEPDGRWPRLIGSVEHTTGGKNATIRGGHVDATHGGVFRLCIAGRWRGAGADSNSGHVDRSVVGPAVGVAMGILRRRPGRRSGRLRLGQRQPTTGPVVHRRQDRAGKTDGRAPRGVHRGRLPGRDRR